MSRKGIILFNPKAATYGYRIPNSILQVAASIRGDYDYVIVDGNREEEPWLKIEEYLRSGEFSYFCLTVMPGPQLKQAIPYSRRSKEHFPDVQIIWGGYFASNQYEVVLNSGVVDYVIDGPGDHAFPELLNRLENNLDLIGIKNLIFKSEEGIHKGPREPLLDQDELPELPYNELDRFYSIKGYLPRTHLGGRTASYHSSMGCPFSCSFCGIVPIYNARWKAKSAKLVFPPL